MVNVTPGHHAPRPERLPSEMPAATGDSPSEVAARARYCASYALMPCSRASASAAGIFTGNNRRSRSKAIANSVALRRT